MNSIAIKDSQGFVTEEGRAAILACKGKMSLRQAQAHFGVSGRTIGRIFNDGDKCPKVAGSSGAEVQELKALIAQQQEMIKSLLSQPAPQAPVTPADASLTPVSATVQRYRRPLNPQWHQKSEYSSDRNYSSPYSKRPGTPVIVANGIHVGVPQFIDARKDSSTRDFLLEQKSRASPGYIA